MPERKGKPETNRTIERSVALPAREIDRTRGWMGSSCALKYLRQKRPAGSRESARLVIQSLDKNKGQATLLPPHQRYASLMFYPPDKHGCQIEFSLPLGSEPRTEKAKTRTLNCPNTTPAAVLKITTDAWANLQKLLAEPITGQIETKQNGRWQEHNKPFSLPSLKLVTTP
ncbi:MAG: hypothetical protein ABH807_02435 [Candidatus Shapirobacteria bacterium]